MRKHQKQTIANFIELLLEANDEIPKTLKAENTDQALELLAQCQEGAVKAGTLIEESEGEGFKAIGLLEQYCEDVYRLYEELNQGQIENRNKALKKLRKQLIQIENSIKHDIRETIEVVFLPYKASMWDSLESVWQAAEEDETCEAYVIPIPYYDRNPDGSFGEMHYEADKYPGYVPITHYEGYDLEEHHPDVIYIHNPYDGQNLVTSVHPDFYSDKLKQYTDCLVYIPYFVLGEFSPDNREAVDSMKHFCTVPGVVNADKVIVQSEDMRKVYVDVLTEQTGEHTRQYWEDKILGLGSPKFDRVQKANQMEQEIPEEWIRIIQKPDGSRKNVILYNTSVGALLRHEEEMLEKMQQVFQIFKENQEDVALLWRPHPLIQETIESMRPQLWSKYDQIVKKYCLEGWGIYDTTADVDRAIALSDAYYGDESSLIQMCQCIGKRIMIQNVDVKDVKLEYIIVQAGGKGTRLKHLTRNKPKALVPVENLPMLFHLFQKYPDKKFIILADYQKEALRGYLSAFAKVDYLVVDAQGSGTCAGVQQALELIPERHPFMLLWSDLILSDSFALPAEYQSGVGLRSDYIGISETFSCRWSYADGELVEQSSCENGVAGLFLFTDKSKLKGLPQDGELVRWLQQKQRKFQRVSLAGTKEFGLLEEYEKLEPEPCRPFNRITVRGDRVRKEPLDEQGERLSRHECAWYQEANRLMQQHGKAAEQLPRIYGTNPLEMEWIKGRNIDACKLNHQEKGKLLDKIIESLRELHDLAHIQVDPFSVKKAYFDKTMERLSRIEDLVPFARERTIWINGKECRNVYFHKRELEQRLETLSCTDFCFIHGDCTFSNMLLRDNQTIALIDPRGYFGNTQFYGDVRYDWAKLYYSIAGNYDRFNRREFQLYIGKTAEEGIRLDIASNRWEDMEEEFFAQTGANEEEIKLLHAVIWLSLTTYAWQDYDSICGAFYNGLSYLEDLW